MANLKSVYTRPLSSLDDLGKQLSFYIRALAAAPQRVDQHVAVADDQRHEERRSRNVDSSFSATSSLKLFDV